MFPNPTLHGPFHAIAERGERVRRNNVFGLYDQTGAPLPDCDVKGAYFTSNPLPLIAPPEELPVVEEPVLFAGLSPPQFGHVITNSLGRLWALDQLPKNIKLLYLPHRRPRMSQSPHLIPILRMLGVEAEPIMHSATTRYHNIYTASDLFSERWDGASHPEFIDWLASRLPPSGPIDQGKKVYVSRVGLGHDVGRFCNEHVLQHLLVDNGFEVFSPEFHSLQEQIETYQTASQLIFAESSALHMFALVGREGQTAAVIQRREELPSLIQTQLTTQNSAKVTSINAISEIYWPEKRAVHSSIAVLDFNIIQASLIEAGLLTPQSPWRAPTQAELTQSLRAGLDKGEKLIPDAEREAWLKDYRQQRRREMSA